MQAIKCVGNDATVVVAGIARNAIVTVFNSHVFDPRSKAYLVYVLLSFTLPERTESLLY